MLHCANGLFLHSHRPIIIPNFLNNHLKNERKGVVHKLLYPISAGGLRARKWRRPRPPTGWFVLSPLNFLMKKPRGDRPRAKLKKITFEATENTKRTNKGWPDQHCWVKPLAAFGKIVSSLVLVYFTCHLQYQLQYFTFDGSEE